MFQPCNSPYIVFGNKKIHFLFDFSQLTKCVSYNLMKHNLKVGNKVVSWKDIKEFYKMDKTKTSTPKLTQRHVKSAKLPKNVS